MLPIILLAVAIAAVALFLIFANPKNKRVIAADQAAFDAEVQKAETAAQAVATEVNGYPPVPGCKSVSPAAILQTLQRLEKELLHMTQATENLTAAAAALAAQVSTTTAEIAGLKSQVAAATTDDAAVQAAADSVNASVSSLASA